MTLLERIRARIAEVETEAEGILTRARDEGRSDLTTEETESFAALREDLEGLRAREAELQEIEEARRRADESRQRFEGNGANRRRDLTHRADPWADGDYSRGTAAEVRSRAVSAVEEWPADDTLRQSATTMLERLNVAHPKAASDARGVAAHVLRYSNPHYISAFRKYVADPEGYLAGFTPEERQVWAEAREYQRATLDTDGAVLPSPLDPTVVLTSDGQIDPMRGLARVDTTTAKSKRYITSEGSTFSFDPELAEVSDDTPTLGEVEIETHKAQGWIEASIEAAMDQPNFDSEVSTIIAEGKAALEASRFVVGSSGSDEPEGIVMALLGTDAEETGALDADNAYALIEALPARYRARAVWQLNLTSRNTLYRLWNPSGTEPPLVVDDTIAGRRYVENSNFEDGRLVVGDWSRYCILDRVGLSVFYVGPGIIRGQNGLPDGRVGWYSFWRVGAGVLDAAENGAGFKMLSPQGSSS